MMRMLCKDVRCKMKYREAAMGQLVLLAAGVQKNDQSIISQY